MTPEPKYDWDAIFIQAAQIASEHTSPHSLAVALDIPPRTFAHAMDRHGLRMVDLQLGSMAALSEQSLVEKLRLQKKSLSHDLDALSKELGRREWWRETLIEVASTLTPEYVPPPPLIPKPERSQTAMLLLSDIHLGQFTPSEQVGLFGEYNKDIALARFRHTFTTFSSIAKHQPFAIEEVVVVCLGDWVEHAHLRPGHEGRVDLNAIKQALMATNCGVAGLRMLAETFPLVRVVCVPGNHGRVAADYRLCDPTDNFDYMVYRIMEMALSNQPNITWTIPEAWYANFKVYHHNFFTMHGENIRSYVGFPWYGATRAIRKYVAMFRLAQKRKIRDTNPQTRDEFEECLIVPDYALLAHFHSSTTWEAPDVEHFVNGAMPGVSEYGAKKVMVINRPRQRMMFVHGKYGVTMRCPIDLDEVG